MYAKRKPRLEMKQFVLDNKKETLALYFTDVRYTKSNNENIFCNVIEFLQKQGFRV